MICTVIFDDPVVDAYPAGSENLCEEKHNRNMKVWTYIFRRIVSTSVMCIIIFVNKRANTRYRTERAIAAADTRSRSHNADLRNCQC